jgi:threonine dehydrogenase-like Zn-dependent dehydrogenase
MATAKAMGARKIIAVDIQESRLKFAGSYAATYTYLPEKREFFFFVMFSDENIKGLFWLAQEGEARTTYSRRIAKDISERFGLTESGKEGIDLTIDCSSAEVSVLSKLLFSLRIILFFRLVFKPEFISLNVEERLFKSEWVTILFKSQSLQFWPS